MTGSDLTRRGNAGRLPTVQGAHQRRSRFEHPAIAGVDVWALPRGQHKLQRGDIAASQRARIFYALSQCCAAKGYAATTLNDLCQLAKISKSSFYAQFADKEACYIAAYEAAHYELSAAMVRSQDLSTDAVTRTRDALAGYLRYNAENPTVARTFLVEIHAVGPRVWAKHEWGHRRTARRTQALYRIRRAEHPELPDFPESVFLTLVTAVEEMVCTYVRKGKTADVMNLLPQALFMFEACYAAPPSVAALLHTPTSDD